MLQQSIRWMEFLCLFRRIEWNEHEFIVTCEMCSINIFGMWNFVYTRKISLVITGNDLIATSASFKQIVNTILARLDFFVFEYTLAGLSSF